MSKLIFDREGAMHRVLGDAAFLNDMVKMLWTQAPDALSSLRAALAKKDANALARAAHIFKGSCSNVGASAVSEVLTSIEKIGRTGSVEGADAFVGQIEGELQKFKEEYESFARTQAL